MKELKPCPFCGNKDIKTEYSSYGVPNPRLRFLIFCDKCDVEMVVTGDDCPEHRQEAFDKWNTISAMYGTVDNLETVKTINE